MRQLRRLRRLNLVEVAFGLLSGVAVVSLCLVGGRFSHDVVSSSHNHRQLSDIGNKQDHQHIAPSDAHDRILGSIHCGVDILGGDEDLSSCNLLAASDNPCRSAPVPAPQRILLGCRSPNIAAGFSRNLNRRSQSTPTARLNNSG